MDCRKGESVTSHPRLRIAEPPRGKLKPYRAHATQDAAILAYREEKERRGIKVDVTAAIATCVTTSKKKTRKPYTRKSYCKRGHPKTAEFSFTRPDGYGECMICSRERARNRYRALHPGAEGRKPGGKRFIFADGRTRRKTA